MSEASAKQRRRVVIYPGLDKCPVCGADLRIEAAGSPRQTACVQCPYLEAPGSAHLLSLVARSIRSQLADAGPEEITYRDEPTDAHHVACPNGLLPIVSEYVNAQLGALGLLEPCEGICTIEDTNGLLQKRSVLGSAQAVQYAPLLVVMHLAAIDQAMTVSALLSPGRKRLRVETLYTPAGAPSSDALSTLNRRDLAPLVAQAAKQMAEPAQ